MLGLYDTGTFLIIGAASSGRQTSTIAYTAYKEPWWCSMLYSSEDKFALSGETTYIRSVVPVT